MQDDPLTQPEPVATSSAAWWGVPWQRLHSRFARQLALAAVLIGGVAAAGHFIGGMIGWWHAYEITFRSHDTRKPAESTARAKASAPLLSVVVLPFENAGAPEDAWFVESLTNDIALELSRVPDSSVIGREAAARYRGREVDPREIAQELGVRYVLVGSAERIGDKVRLRTRLLDGETGAQRWAERLDVERAALPGKVDQMAKRLVNDVGLEMVRSAGSAVSRLAPEAVQADELAMQGWAALYRGVNVKNNAEALALFERAVAMDPRSVRGWGGVAYAGGNQRRWEPARAEHALRRIEEAAAQLGRLDPDGYYGLIARVVLATHRRDAQAALAAGERMVELFPGHHGAYLARGPVLLRMGRFEEALADTEKAIALLPNDPAPFHEWRRAFIFFALGRYAEAAVQARKTLTRHPTDLGTASVLAAALSREGKLDEARQVLDEARRHEPDLSLRIRKANQTWLDGWHERFFAARDDQLAALREAGLE